MAGADSKLPPLNSKLAGDFLESKIRQYADINSSLAAKFNELVELYPKKYWHQLTEKLLHFVDLEVFSTGDELVQLYNNFLREFETKINPLSLAQLLVKISRQLTPAEAIQFLENAVERLKSHKEAALTLTTHIALINLRNKKHDNSKKKLEEAKTLLASLTGVDQLTYSSFYFAASEYHRELGTPAEFYNNGLLFLAHTPLELIEDEKKKALAFDLCLAALVGEGIYNFGEMLSHPLLKSIEGSSFGWIAEFIKAFHSGNILKYEELVKSYEAVLLAQPALVAHQQLLKEKISILALMELLSTRDRVVSFAAISQATKLPVDQVEMLVMKAFSLKLVKGKIDEVEQEVSFTWVQPRVLTAPQIVQMQERLEKWIQTVHSTHLFVETETPDLIA